MSFKHGDWITHNIYGPGRIDGNKLPDGKYPIINFENGNWTRAIEVEEQDLLPNHDIFPAYDSRGELITVGCKVLYPMSKGGFAGAASIKEGKVESIDKPTHRGYGIWTRQLKIRDDRSKKIITHNYPANCIKMAGI